jgi:hypothetical protein
MTFSGAEEVRPRTADSLDCRDAVLEGQSIKESFDEYRVETNSGGGRILPPRNSPVPRSTRPSIGECESDQTHS